MNKFSYFRTVPSQVSAMPGLALGMREQEVFVLMAFLASPRSVAHLT